MKSKHITLRINQALEVAKTSNCPRRQFGALLINPERNTLLMDGYNGAPRGGGKLCYNLPGGHEFCSRDGLDPSKLVVLPDGEDEDCYLEYDGNSVPSNTGPLGWRKDLILYRETLLERFPAVKSGTRMEVGCHHAEMNVICNAAFEGVSTKGTWMFITGEPCTLCAKLIHHAGIARVVVVDGGYGAEENGVSYLKSHGVEVFEVYGPTDPRIQFLSDD